MTSRWRHTAAVRLVVWPVAAGILAVAPAGNGFADSSTSPANAYQNVPASGHGPIVLPRPKTYSAPDKRPSDVGMMCNGFMVSVQDHGPIAPKGFDPETASSADLEAYGYPPKPTEPAALALWQTAVHKPAKWVVPPCLPQRPASTVHRSASTSSENWSGNVASGHTWTDVELSYTVPRVTAPSGDQPSHISIWPGLGLGGGKTDQLVQGGTQIDLVNNVQTNYDWYEFFPAMSMQPIGFNESPGDPTYVHVTWKPSTRTGVFHYIDTGSGTSFNVLITPPPLQSGLLCKCSTSEWILERTEITSGTCNWWYVADFGTESLTNAEATYPGGAWEGVGNTPSHYGLFMQDAIGHVMATPKALTGGGTGFPIAWGSYGTVNSC